MPVRIQTADFDSGREIAALCAGDPRVGAVASFIGVVRDLNDGDRVSTLFLEHYPGMTEREVAWELESFMRTHGASAVSFELIVGSGPNGALPHLHPTGRAIQAGEPVVMDLGCVVDGYCSDVTRTVCLGEPKDSRYMELWNLVLKANETARTGVKAGVTGVEGDKLGRDVIAEAGYGNYFGHGLGHGVGLAIHEGPRFSFAYPDRVPVGAVMTIEPGVYLPGWGGIRIEDMVLVREGGVEVLTGAPKVAILDR